MTTKVKAADETPAETSAETPAETPAADNPGAVATTPFTPEQERARDVRTSDVVALNPAPDAVDASVKIPEDAITLEEARAEGVFISAGMMSDLEHHGFVRSPVDGRAVRL